MGALSGLAFGTVEAVKYAEAYAQIAVSASSFMSLVVWRLLTDSLFHAVTAGVSGYFIALATLHRRWRRQLLVFGVGLMSLLHGINDDVSQGWLQVVVAAALLFTFLGYIHNGENVQASLASIAGPEGKAGHHNRS